MADKNFKLTPSNFPDFDGAFLYFAGVWIVGMVIGLGIWVYAFISWGLLLGLVFGWIPALIGGTIAGFLWPLVVLVVAILAFAIFS